MIMSFSIIPMLMSIFSCSGAKYIDMDVTEFGLLLKEQEAALIDVRTDKEYAEGHIAGAILIDQFQSDFAEQVKAKLPKDKVIAIYCRSGRRSANAAGKLADIGYKCVNLKGGILAWKEVGMSVTAPE